MKIFDKNDDTTMGRPLYFDIPLYLKAVELMIVSDEVEFALKMLDSVPAYYRENPTAKIKEMRAAIYRQLLTPHSYAQDRHEETYDIDCGVFENHGQYWPRPGLVKNYVKDLGVPVNIYEYSPGTYAIPKTLDHYGMKFGYRGYTINELALLKHKSLLDRHPLIEGAKNIFLCFETIEHLFDPEAHLKHWIGAQGIEFDAVFISTPLGTLMGGLDNWRNRELGHIRTYTGPEFMALCARIAPGYQWAYVNTHMQILVGQKNPIPIRVDQPKV